MSKTRFETGIETLATPDRHGRMANARTAAPDEAQGTRFIRPGQGPMAEPEHQAQRKKKRR